MRIWKGLCAGAALALACQAVWGQSAYKKFEVDATVDYARAESAGAFGAPTGSPGGGFAFGFRPVRHFMVETGMDYIHAAMFPESAATASGASGTYSATITDHTIFVPIGGRVVLPLGGERVLFSAGGGVGIVANYERAVGSGKQIDCNGYCESKTSAGPYEAAQLLVAVDRAGHFGVGMTGRVSQAPIKSGSWFLERKNWYTLSGVFSLRF